MPGIAMTSDAAAARHGSRLSMDLECIEDVPHGDADIFDSRYAELLESESAEERELKSALYFGKKFSDIESSCFACKKRIMALHPETVVVSTSTKCMRTVVQGDKKIITQVDVTCECPEIDFTCIDDLLSLKDGSFSFICNGRMQKPSTLSSAFPLQSAPTFSMSFCSSDMDAKSMCKLLNALCDKCLAAPL